MSLILEALRKSEAERRRDSAPDVALELPPAPVRTARVAPPWLWPLLMSVAALAVLGGWLGSRLVHRDDAAASAPPLPATRTEATPAAMPRVVPRPAAPPAPAAAIAPLPAPSTPIAASPAAADTHAPAPPAQAAAAASPPALPPQSTVAPPALPAAPLDGVPDIAATALPPVKLSMHMWDADPARRFVILDGKRLGEGERSGELGVIVIDRKGVVVERNGQRARIPLP